MSYSNKTGISYSSLAKSATLIPSMVQPYLPRGWSATVIPESSPDDPVKYSAHDKTVYIPAPPDSQEAMTHYLARIHTVLGTVEKYGVHQMQSQSAFKFYKQDGTAHPIAWVYNDLLALQLYRDTIYEGRKKVLHKDMATLFEQLDTENLSAKMVRYHKALADVCISLGMDNVSTMGSSKYLDRLITQELDKDPTLKQLYALSKKIIDKLDDEDEGEGEGDEGDGDGDPVAGPEDGDPTESQDSMTTQGKEEKPSSIGRPDEVEGDTFMPSYNPSEMFYDENDMKVDSPYVPPFGEDTITVNYPKPLNHPLRRTIGMPGSLVPTKDTRVVGFDKCGLYGFAKNKTYKSIVNQGLPLARQLRSLLTEETRSRRTIGERGRLQGSRLYQIATGGEARYGRGARKQFVHSSASYEMNSHCTILCDLSGSMGGDKAVYAAATLNVLYQVLAPLQASFSVLGFTDAGGYGDTKLAMKVMFDSRTEKVMLPQSEVTARLDYAFGAMRANPDTDAVFYATLDAMSTVKAKRKIILVLSDGSPSSSRRQGAHPGQLKALIHQVGATPNTTIFGLGILTSAVSRFYPDHKVINHIADITPAILSFIHHNIIASSNH